MSQMLKIPNKTINSVMKLLLSLLGSTDQLIQCVQLSQGYFLSKHNSNKPASDN